MKYNLSEEGTDLGALIWVSLEMMDSVKWKAKGIKSEHYSNGEHPDFPLSGPCGCQASTLPLSCPPCMYNFWHVFLMRECCHSSNLHRNESANWTDSRHQGTVFWRMQKEFADNSGEAVIGLVLEMTVIRVSSAWLVSRRSQMNHLQACI